VGQCLVAVVASVVPGLQLHTAQQIRINTERSKSQVLDAYDSHPVHN